MLAHLIPWVVFDTMALVIFMSLPMGMSQEALFGVEIGQEAYRGPGRRVLRRYWFWLVMALVGAEAIGLLAALYGTPLRPLYLRVSLLALLNALAFSLYLAFSRQIKAFELADENRRFAFSLKTRRMIDYTNVPLEVAIAAITMTTLAVLVYYYPALPEQLAAARNSSGEAAAWSHKSLISVFGLLAMTIYAQGLLLLVKQGLVWAKITLPAEQTDEYLRMKEEALAINISLWDWLRGLVAVYSLLSLDSVFGNVEALRFLLVAINQASYIGWMLFVVYASYFGIRLSGVYRRQKAAAGRLYLQQPFEAARWYAGGLFYFNPDDTALFVESRTCPSYTLNFGNPRAYLYVVLTVGLFLPPLWLVLSR